MRLLNVSGCEYRYGVLGQMCLVWPKLQEAVAGRLNKADTAAFWLSLGAE